MFERETAEIDFGKVCPYLKSTNKSVWPPLTIDYESNTCDFTHCPIGKRLIEVQTLFLSSAKPITVVVNLSCEGCSDLEDGFSINTEAEVRPQQIYLHGNLFKSL